MLEIFKQMAKVSEDLEKCLERGTTLQDIKKNELKLAFLSADLRKIDEARQACIDTYSGNLDELIRLYTHWIELRKKLPV